MMGLNDQDEATRPVALEQARDELAQTQAALAESLATSELLQSVLDASQDCIKVLNAKGELIFMNDGGRAVMEVDDFGAILGCPWVGFWEGDGREAAEVALAAARRGETARFRGAAKTAKGNEKYWDVTVKVLAGGSESGPEELILSISKDITAERELDQQRDLVMRESAHRVKNILAVVQAVANQSLRTLAGPELDGFNLRLTALAKAQQMLLETDGEEIQLRELVEAALAPICGPTQAAIDGCDLRLDPERAFALAMALHELATNALKYGALTREDGQVSVRWRVEAGSLHFEWREAGGPLVSEPEREGFGTRVITRNLEAHFRGKVLRRFEPAGLVLTLTAPLHAWRATLA